MPRARRARPRGLAPAVLAGLLSACLATANVPPERSPTDGTEDTPPGDVVVLLHGLGRGRWSMASLGRSLERAGLQVVNIGYPSRSLDMPELVEHLDAELDELGLSSGDPIEVSVHFVGHSAGAILSRAFLAEHRDYPVGRVVQLAPPNAGSSLARNLGDVPFFDAAIGPLGTTLAAPLDSVPHYPLGVIAGDHSLLLTSLWTDGEDDGIVAVAETRLEGMADHLVVPHTHTFLMNSRTVQNQVLHFLREGAFSRP